MRLPDLEAIKGQRFLDLSALHREPAELRTARLAKLIIAGKQAAAHMARAAEAVAHARKETLKGVTANAAHSHGAAGANYAVAVTYVLEMEQLLG